MTSSRCSLEVFKSKRQPRLLQALLFEWGVARGVAPTLPLRQCDFLHKYHGNTSQHLLLLGCRVASGVFELPGNRTKERADS